MFEKMIQVKPDEKTENFIKEWMELKKNQLDLTSGLLYFRTTSEIFKVKNVLFIRRENCRESL